MELIPGLPNDDVALQCLIRVRFEDFPLVSSVCRSWNAVFHHPQFSMLRKSYGFSEQVIIIAHKEPRHERLFVSHLIHLSLCEPQTGKLTELPPIPGYSDGLPMVYQIVTVGYNIVLIHSSVFIYNLVSRVWRSGSNMPGPRWSFACASDNNHTVFVAGGYDSGYNALKSSLSYDVDNDKWTKLDDMAIERAQCKGVFQQGKFYVIGEYRDRMSKEGWFHSAQAFDVARLKWDDEVKENIMTCVDDGDRMLYMDHESNMVVALSEDDGSFQVITALPEELSNRIKYLVASDKNLVVMGSCWLIQTSKTAYLLDFKSHQWREMQKLSGYIHFHCCLEI